MAPNTSRTIVNGNISNMICHYESTNEWYLVSELGPEHHFRKQISEEEARAKIAEYDRGDKERLEQIECSKYPGYNI